MTLDASLAALPVADEGGAVDAFLRGAPFAAYQQTLGWPAAVPRHGRRAWRLFVARDGGRIVGAGVVRVTRLAAGAWLGTLPRGPIVHDPAHLAPVLAALERVLRADGCCSVRIGPRVRGRDLPAMAEAMRAAGYSPLRAAEQALHQVTGIVWLDKPEQEVLAGFKQRGRRALRAADRSGVTIRPVADDGDLERYQQLLDAFGAARPGYDRSGQPDARGQAALIAAAGGQMLLAERAGATIGAHAWVRQADEAIWLSLATVDRDGASPGYPLLWAGMRAARMQGCIGYDLAGLPDDDEPLDAGERGRLQFKTAFAPHRRQLPAAHELPLAPLKHRVLVGARATYRAWRRWRSAGAAAAHG